ncbi:MAG: ATP-binding cassette subfamily C bacterial CydC [Chloroflexi bacterium]|nr:MAG: ATP-binding cassette subfamily C bacterial CydC [Chloroflexota bacterium]
MRTTLKLLRFLKPFVKEILLSILLGVATIAAGIGMLGTSAYLIASAALHPSIAELQVAIVGVRFFGISRAGFRYLERLVSHSVNLRVLSHLREWFYRQVESAPPAELYTKKVGDLLDRVMGDLETLENFYVRVISPVVVALVTGIGVSLFIGGYAVELGMILAAGLFITGFILPLETILVTYKTAREMTDARSGLSSRLVETLQGLEDLQTYGMQTIWFDEIKKESRKSGEIQLKLALLSGINSGLSLAILNLIILGVLWTAIPMVDGGSISGVTLAVITLLAMASFESTATLPQAAQNLNASLESARRLFSISGSSQSNRVISTEKFITTPRSIRLEEVNFRYAQDQAFQLLGINLFLEQGKKVALIGPSGAGKTSLMNLLLRFWSPDEGKMYFDNIESTRINPYVSRAFFGVISQKTYLFSASLRDNLLLANPNATEAELHQVLRLADLYERVNKLPQGLDTWVGDQGLRLSGGERQRVAIARALLQDRPFLLLDEPDIHMDPFTGNKIMKTIFDVFQHCGIFFITHDFSHMEQMDEIILLGLGRIIERGNHKSMLLDGGNYAALNALKNQWIAK